MSPWRCGIDGCGTQTETVEELIHHQTTQHTKHECQVCGTIVPDGYFAIRHAFEEHTRAEYVRAYDADSEAVRRREAIKTQIESEADLEAVIADLDAVN
jgi:DNA repair exonuclease SbcCD ATPase subunit